MAKEKLNLELGAWPRRYYGLGLVFTLLMLALSVWLWSAGPRWLALLGGLIFSDMLIAVFRSRRWARPLLLKGERLCRGAECRRLNELSSARFEIRNAAWLANMREGAIALEWKGGEVWRAPLSLCGWQELWRRIREQRPDLQLDEWREDATLRRIWTRSWDMPFCAPSGQKRRAPSAKKWLPALLALIVTAAALGALSALLEIRLGYRLPSWVAAGLAGAAGSWLLRKVLASSAESGAEEGS